MKVLSIDLGGALIGWAYHDGPALLSVGTWSIETRRTESEGVRWLRFSQLLNEVVDVARLAIDLVAYEEVVQHVSRDKRGETRMNTAAAHVYGGGKAVLLSWCESRGFEYVSVPIPQVKRAATGKGGGKGTDKAAVLAAARRRWRHHEFKDDNAADAAFIGRAVLLDLGVIKPDREEPKHDPRQTGLPLHH